MQSYLIALLLVAGPCAIFRRDAMSRVASALILNWVAGYLFNEVFHTTTPWAWSFAIDTVSAVIVLWSPACRWQALIGASYIVQIMMHAMFALGRWHPHSYWEALTAVAWLQLALLLLWGGAGVAHRHAFDVRRRAVDSFAPHSRDLGGK